MTKCTLEERKYEHLKKFRQGHNQTIHRAFRKYGWNCFEWTELCSVLDEKHLCDLEKYFINYYDTFKNGYNMTIGGEGVISGEFEKYYLVRFPDGTVKVVKGYNKFCREYGLNRGSLHLTMFPSKKHYTKQNGTVSTYNKVPKKHHKGFTLLGRFNDYPEREYAQASGNGEHPEKDGDIVSSAGKLAAA